MDAFSYAESVVIQASPEALYDLVSDITRTGEWSPICRACWWQDGDGPREGAWFSGRNEADGVVWETDSRVDVARPGREFAWLVGGKYARWSFRMEPRDDSTELTEAWEFLPEGRAMFQNRYADQADQRINRRSEQARASIPATLAAIKRIAETA